MPWPALLRNDFGHEQRHFFLGGGTNHGLSERMLRPLFRAGGQMQQRVAAQAPVLPLRRPPPSPQFWGKGLVKKRPAFWLASSSKAVRGCPHFLAPFPQNWGKGCCHACVT